MKQFKSQSGRSMVEMLGVLAIIGVLSIGGIAGYSYGMDKYRANETTNQIMLRAIDLMTQAGNGNETLSLSAWENEQTQYTFGEIGYTHDGLIYLDVAGLPKNICEVVYDNLSSMTKQIDINAVRSESKDVCAEENEMTFYFEGGISATCDPACPEGQYCDNGICFKGGVPEGSDIIALDKECTSEADCNTDWIGTCASCAGNKCYISTGYNGVTCTIKEGNVPGQCNVGTCVPKGCTTNDDCTEVGTYCASTNRSGEARFQSGEMGSCVPLDFIRKEFGGETYYISNTRISWWDAEYACDAIGKTVGKNIKMVEVTDLVEASTWNGERDHDITFTAFGQELKAQVGHNGVWTQNLPKDDEYAFFVDSGGNVGIDYRQALSTFFAVCR